MFSGGPRGSNWFIVVRCYRTGSRQMSTAKHLCQLIFFVINVIRVLKSDIDVNLLISLSLCGRLFIKSIRVAHKYVILVSKFC